MHYGSSQPLQLFAICVSQSTAQFTAFIREVIWFDDGCIKRNAEST